MIKNVIIVLLILIIGYLGYEHYSKKEGGVSYEITRVNDSSTLSNNKKNVEATYTYGKSAFKYDSNVWNIEENRYCFPSEGENGRKYDGTPCDVVGLTFIYKLNTEDGTDNIFLGGYQPLSCNRIRSATKCDDKFALVTSSEEKLVWDYYDYLLSVLNNSTSN